jgi:hypothetical protein
MTDARDPRLEALFHAAREELSGEAFAAEVMARVGRSRRRALAGWVAVAVVLFAAAWLVSGPLTNAVHLLTQLLPQSLVEIEAGNQLLAQLLAPINSIAGVVALGLFGLRLAYKKIFA